MTKDNPPPKPSKMHSLRVPDEVWARAVTEAAERGESVAAAVVRLLTWYGDGNDPTRKPTDAPFAPAPGWTLARSAEERED
jgi:hypothetical protein